MSTRAQTLVIACGAISHEITALQRRHGWDHIKLQCLPASLHNTPDQIPDALRAKIHAAREHYDHIFIGYADCGTGGLLDKLCAEEGVERLPGDHCYAFFSGIDQWPEIADEELGTFYLTDFLARHFERLIWRGMGLDRHPELRPMIFGHYRRVLYLAQRPTDELRERARAAAQMLELDYDYLETGYGDLDTGLERTLKPAVEQPIQWRS